MCRGRAHSSCWTCYLGGCASGRRPRGWKRSGRRPRRRPGGSCRRVCVTMGWTCPTTTQLQLRRECSSWRRRRARGRRSRRCGAGSSTWLAETRDPAQARSRGADIRRISRMHGDCSGTHQIACLSSPLGEANPALWAPRPGPHFFFQVLRSNLKIAPPPTPSLGQQHRSMSLGGQEWSEALGTLPPMCSAPTNSPL